MFGNRVARYPIITLCAAFMALYSLCSCSSTGSVTPTSGNPQQTGSSLIGTEAMNSFFPATGEQFADGARFVGVEQALSGILTNKCMERYGFTSTAGSSASAATIATDFVDNAQFPDLARIAAEKRFIPGQMPQDTAQPPKAEMVAYSADSKKCAGTDPFRAVLKAGNPLQRQWYGIVEGIQTSPAVTTALTGFASCMEKAGVPADSAGSLTDFEAWLSGTMSRLPVADFPAAQAHWTGVFVPCATPVVSTQERLQLTAKAQFLQQHFTQVHALENLASQVVTTTEQQTGTAGTAAVAP
jgi:hypothetical protein